MFIKVCGITDPTDGVAAVQAGADAVGLNFVPSSIRRVTRERAHRILEALPPGVLTVGVFRDHVADEVLTIVEALGLGGVQLHGDEPPDVVAAIAERVDTVIDVVTVDRLRTLGSDHPATIVMLDGPRPGSGEAFDWDTVGDMVDHYRVLLAGGLGPDNVSEAIERVRPWGVDAASGVELAPGRKDAEAMRRFVDAARAAGASIGR